MALGVILSILSVIELPTRDRHRCHKKGIVQGIFFPRELVDQSNRRKYLFWVSRVCRNLDLFEVDCLSFYYYQDLSLFFFFLLGSNVSAMNVVLAVFWQGNIKCLFNIRELLTSPDPTKYFPSTQILYQLIMLYFVTVR